MKTLTEKYRGVLSESFSKKQFVRDARMEWPQFVNQFTGFNDAVAILKQKGMISEEDKMPEYAEFHNLSDDAIRRGIDAELEAMGLMSHDKVSEEDQAKAKEKALKNLKKDPLHYLNLMSGESNKVDKHDQMVEPNEKNKVDTFNGMKKATLKESIGDPRKLKPGDDDPDNPFGIIRRVKKGKNGYEIFGKEGSEQYYYFVDFDGNEMDEDDFIYEKVDEGAAKKLDMIRQHLHKKFTDPNNPKNKVIDDEMIDGFFSVAPDNLLDMDMDEVELEYDNYVDANYDRIDEDDMVYDPKTRGLRIAKSVDDVIDPHDYVEIGQGYLKGFKRPHSLKDADLETLGRKVVKVLARGDINKAKAKFVDEVMGIDRKGNKKPEDSPSNYTKPNMEEELSDEDMKAIEKYGHPDKTVKPFKPGDMWSNDFDYEGMLEFGMKIRLNTPIATLQALYNSFEDVNYHTENSHLGMAIDAIEDGDKSEALDHIRNFKKEVKKTLVGINEGSNPNRRELEEAEVVVKEGRGDMDMITRIIDDRADESGFEPREEAAEVIAAIAEHYKLNLKMIQNYMDSDEPVNPFNETNENANDLPEMQKHNQLMDKAVDFFLAKAEEYGVDMNLIGNFNQGRNEFIEALFKKRAEKYPDQYGEAKGKDHDGDGDIDSKDYLAAKDKAIKKAMGKDEMVRENIKAIIQKVLEEGTINEAATQELAKMADSYAGFDGMKAVVMSLQDVVTEIERFYDNTRNKIQKAFDSMGEVRNEEGLKVGGFLSPAVENAFNKDLRPVVKQGFTKGLEQPKVKVLSQADLDAARMGGPVAEAEPKQTVYSPVNEDMRSPNAEAEERPHLKLHGKQDSILNLLKNGFGGENAFVNLEYSIGQESNQRVTGVTVLKAYEMMYDAFTADGNKKPEVFLDIIRPGVYEFNSNTYQFIVTKTKN